MLVYGKQVFFYILQNHKDLVNEIYLAKECDKATFSTIASFGFKIKKLDFKTAQAMAKGGNHQGFLLNIKDYEFYDFNKLKKSDFLVILYGLSDIGNIGAITRSAYALGADGIIFIGQKLNMDGVIRTSSGAAIDMPIVLNNDILTILNELKQIDFKIYASSGDGKNIQEINLNHKKKALIMGSEGFGIPSKIIKKCDECVGIKMKNNFDSLNVNAAFAILCDRMINA